MNSRKPDEPRWGFFLTIGRDQKGRLIAVLTDGSPQHGHDPVTVLSMRIVKDEAEAREWFTKETEGAPLEAAPLRRQQ